MYKVSVIMPIFNGEEYVKNSLNSVINQTIGFENIELIIIDDCSTDGTKNILKNYSKKYSNINLIFLDKNHGNPGIPRNIGIKSATSEYIMFIDDDDEYLPEICDKLYNTLILEDADIVVCNTVYTDNQFDKKCWGLYSDNLYLRGKEIIYFKNRPIWNCIFKKSIILDNNIDFPRLDLAEDVIFLLNYFVHSNKLIYLNDFVGYHHITRNDSLSYQSADVTIDDIKTSYILAKILKENKCDFSRYFKHDIEIFILSAIMYGGRKDEIKKILSELSDFERKINFKGNLSIDLQVINFFILHGNLDIATYICLFISTVRKSNLVSNIYRKFFLKFHEKV